MAGTEELLDWLRAVCDAFEFDVVATFRRAGDHGWPLVAVDAEDLERQLAAGGHLLPLPREPASLANVLEVAIVDELLRQVEGLDGAEAQRGTERGYPDIEVSGEAFSGGHHAVDVKVARLASGGNRTQSRVTLYTATPTSGTRSSTGRARSGRSATTTRTSTSLRCTGSTPTPARGSVTWS
ncbi:hypothetical protein BH20ACT8_BH20ACT8_20160 [soil metagenome]